MSKKKFSGNISAKGYYIALILCAVAIGISGYLYYRNVNDTDQEAAAPSVAAEAQGEGDVQVVATQPDPDPVGAVTIPTQPDQPQSVGKRVSPVSGSTIAEYAVDALAYNQTTRDWRTHDGLDIAAEPGTQVCAAADGVVYTVFEDDTMGMTVVIRHADGYITQYSSLSQEVLVAPGDEVKLGQAIGTVGTTALLETALGHHVHFSVTCKGAPMDPAQFLALGK